MKLQCSREGGRRLGYVQVACLCIHSSTLLELAAVDSNLHDSIEYLCLTSSIGTKKLPNLQPIAAAAGFRYVRQKQLQLALPAEEVARLPCTSVKCKPSILSDYAQWCLFLYAESDGGKMQECSRQGELNPSLPATTLGNEACHQPLATIFLYRVWGSCWCTLGLVETMSLCIEPHLSSSLVPTVLCHVLAARSLRQPG